MYSMRVEELVDISHEELANFHGSDEAFNRLLIANPVHALLHNKRSQIEHTRFETKRAVDASCKSES